MSTKNSLYTSTRTLDNHSKIKLTIPGTILLVIPIGQRHNRRWPVYETIARLACPVQSELERGPAYEDFKRAAVLYVGYHLPRAVLLGAGAHARLYLLEAERVIAVRQLATIMLVVDNELRAVKLDGLAALAGAVACRPVCLYGSAVVRLASLLSRFCGFICWGLVWYDFC